MEKKEIADFFDRCAPWWDADMIRNEVLITTILDNAGIKGGMDVLDVACGTGVLFPDYLKRGVESVTGIDISPRWQNSPRRNSRKSGSSAAMWKKPNLTSFSTPSWSTTPSPTSPTLPVSSKRWHGW